MVSKALAVPHPHLVSSRWPLTGRCYFWESQNVGNRSKKCRELRNQWVWKCALTSKGIWTWHHSRQSCGFIKRWTHMNPFSTYHMVLETQFPKETFLGPGCFVLHPFFFFFLLIQVQLGWGFKAENASWQLIVPVLIVLWLTGKGEEPRSLKEVVCTLD